MLLSILLMARCNMHDSEIIMIIIEKGSQKHHAVRVRSGNTDGAYF